MCVRLLKEARADVSGPPAPALAPAPAPGVPVVPSVPKPVPVKGLMSVIAELRALGLV